MKTVEITAKFVVSVPDDFAQETLYLGVVVADVRVFMNNDGKPHLIQNAVVEDYETLSTKTEHISVHPSIPGSADCGCIYHAEEGIPCEHDIALAKSKR